MKLFFVLARLALLIIATTPSFALSGIGGIGGLLASNIPYTGHMTENGTAPTGQFDVQFELFDAATGGNKIGPTNLRDDVPVANGTLNVFLNFGDPSIYKSVVYLEISIRPGASTGAFTLQTPRQVLQPTAQSIFAMAAGSVL